MMEQSFRDRAGPWLAGRDKGISSESIFNWMAFGVKSGNGPSDPADLGRCLRLLELFPEWKGRMSEMAEVSRDWALLIPQWDEIVACFLAEAGGSVPARGAHWSAEKTYDMMSSAVYEKGERCWVMRDRAP